MDDSVTDFRQAVQSLYSWDSARQTQANAWLSEFQQTEAAWKACCALLQKDESYEIQFLATSLLLRKVRSDWSRIQLPLKVELRHSFR